MENDKNYLLEAFKSFDSLNEEVFDISLADGLEDAKEFIDEPVEDVAMIVYDSDIEDAEKIGDEDYIGKVILKCEVCQSLCYKNPEDVIIDEESDVVNVNDVCPICQSEEGFKIIGEVAKYCDHCHEEDEEEHDEDKHEDEEHEEVEEVEEKEEIEESLSDITESTERDRIDADADDKKEEAEAEKEKRDDDADSDRDYKLKKHDLEEADKPAAISIEDAQKWVDFDMKRYGEISERTNKLVKKAGFQIVKDDHGDYEVIAGKFESCNEDFERVEIETDTEKMSMTSEDDGKVVVTTEPKAEEEEVKEEEDMIAPLSDEVKVEIEDNTEEEEVEDSDFIDVDFDEVDEEDFNALGESYLKKVYENVAGFKLESGKIADNKLVLEGNITFKSGKVGKTSFIFEAATANKDKGLKFLGENKQLAKGKKAFTLHGRVDGNKLVCESLNYNYYSTDANKNLKRVYGTINR